MSKEKPIEVSIKWSDEDEAYIAYCLNLPGIKTHGANITEALNELLTALAETSVVLSHE